MAISKNLAGVYVIAQHHFRSLAPGELCCNASRPCEGIRSLVDLMDYATIAKQGDANVSHWGSVTFDELAELKAARAAYLEWMSKVSVY